MGTVEVGNKIVSLARKLNSLERGIAVCPDIELETRGIAPDVESRELLFVTSASSTKPGEKLKTGMACSVEKFYYCNRNGHPQSFPLEQVATVGFQGKNRFGTYSPGDKVIVTLENGDQHVLGECMLGCDCSRIAEMLVEAVENIQPVEDITEIRCLSLCDLPKQMQINYMEVLYNYAYLTGCEIDSSEYAALQSIGVRLGLEADVRNELRDYMFLMKENARTKTGVLIKRCKSAMSYGSYEIFRCSLMQDALYLKSVNGETSPWYEDPFLNGLQNVLEILDEQIEVMLIAIHFYKEMQKKDADLKSLNGKVDLLLRRSKSLQIPSEAIFCSGSVYSIDTYHGIRRQRKLKKSITLQRELMLQEVIRNTQISMNHLVEDLNDTTLKLVDEVHKGNLRDQQIQLIMLRQLQNQAKSMVQKNDEVAVVQLYNRLPVQLDAERVCGLLPQQRELIESAYIALPQGSYSIRDDLSYSELSRLVRIEEIMDDEEG